jgi:tRNA dimethylallyltransferase
MKEGYDLIVITGPTASGKTAVAAGVASAIGGEIISADSRQVYRGMDLGTGKDYSDYIVDGRKVPYHLIDITDAGCKYNVFEYQRDFLMVYNNLKERSVTPVVCGGSGMYLDSIVSGYRLLPVPVNEDLRRELADCSLEKLRDILSTYKKLHNLTDVDNKKRAVRAIEIEMFYSSRRPEEISFPEIRPLIFAVSYDREERRRRITRRLRLRLKEGMIEEVERLLASGVDEETLIYYGLEYKYIMLFVREELSYEEMFRGLETAIHRFAKRQMTWFRGMERRGVRIHWIDGNEPLDSKIGMIIEKWQKI